MKGKLCTHEKEAAGEGGLQQVACCRAGIKTEGLVLQELSEEEMKLCSQFTFFPDWRGLWAPRESLLILYASHSVP